MFIARKSASTTDERSKIVDSQDPFATSAVPVAGAIVNPVVAPATSAAADATVGVLNTESIAYGAFGNADSSDHYKFAATPGKTYTLVVTTDRANPNIKTDGFADYFDIYFESSTGARLTTGAQIKQLDLRTKLVEFTVPANAAPNSTYFVQIDNALGKPFEYAIGLYDKSVAPKIEVTSREVTTAAGTTYEVTFTSDIALFEVRPSLERIEVTGGTLTSPVLGADKKSFVSTFTPTGTPAANGALGTVKVLTGAFFSATGNPNLDGGEANNLSTVMMDTTPPKLLSITPSSTLLAANSTPTLTFKFSEAVQGFDLRDITVTGGSLSNLQGSGDTYTATLTRTAGSTSPTVTVTVNPGDYTDLSARKNASTEAFSKTVDFDIKAPVAKITSAKSTISAGESVTLTISFDEPVQGFELKDLTVTEGGKLENLTALDGSGKLYAVTFTPVATQARKTSVTVSVQDGSLTDLAGNAFKFTSTATLNQSVTYTQSVLAMTTSDNKLTVGDAKSIISIELANPTTDFVIGDLVATGGTLGNFVRNANRTSYTVEFTPTANFTGTGSVTVKADSLTANTASPARTLEFVVDLVRPAVVGAITSDKEVLNPGDTAVLTVNFSEAVQPLKADAFNVTNGVITKVEAVGTEGKVYKITVDPTESSRQDVAITLLASKVLDVNGNAMAADVVTTQKVDYTPRVVSITTDDAMVGGGEFAIIAIELSEATTDFTVEDLSVVGGTLVDFGGEGTSYFVSFLPNDNAVVDGKVSVREQSFSNAGGTTNSRGGSVSFKVDTVAPTVAIEVGGPGYADMKLTRGETALITFKLSEPSSTFTAADVVVTEGTLSGFKAVVGTGIVPGTQYTAVFKPVDNTEATGSIRVLAGSFEDAFGNLNVGAARSVIINTTEGTAPASQLVVTQAAALNGSKIDFAVQDVAGADLQVKLGDTVLDWGTINGDGTVTTLTPAALAALAKGELTITNGSDSKPLGLHLAAGTAGNDTVAHAANGADVALFGFAGDDTLIEGAGTVALVGGAGVDTYTLSTTILGETVVVEAGSAIAYAVPLGLLPGFEVFEGFDLITGFDVGTDKLMMPGAVKKVTGVYDADMGTFTVDATGDDLMVYADVGTTGANAPTEGELAVVIVGVGKTAGSVTIIGG